ncbi:MAG: DUF512 domain-containing protein [Firmicutes bacterium]|nr:DUF512 domain-containing protein [Bacillota bacterium]
MGGRIADVLPDSVAEEIGLEAGDVLLSINGQPVRDLIDYNYYSEDEFLELEVKRRDGEIWHCEVEKYADEDLGLVFEANVFDRVRTCRNHCIFCFVDQLQPSPRPSLKVKDDDYRMSFMEGSFITCTNLKEEDYRRIGELKLSPLYISVHTVDPQLRGYMLGRRRPTEILLTLQRLISLGVSIHAQVVLCPDINDGPVLEQTIDSLFNLYPGVRTLAIVPVGLTKFQKNPELRLFTPEEAGALIDLIEGRQRRCLDRCGQAFVYAADELYVKAGRPFPPAELYGDFSQIENGVGMASLFLDQWRSARALVPRQPAAGRVAIATGHNGAYVLAPVVEEINRISGSRVELIEVPNSFYGESITATGLLVGSTLAEALPRGVYSRLLLPVNMFKFDEDVFLDDMTAEELSTRLGCELRITESDPAALISAIFDREQA